MFSVLRIVIIVGVIFVYSPVRQVAETNVRESTRPAARAAGGTGSGLDTLWSALPDAARQTVADRLVAALLGPAPDPGAKARLRPATDTLEPEDLRPAWQGRAAPPS